VPLQQWNVFTVFRTGFVPKVLTVSIYSSPINSPICQNCHIALTLFTICDV
jgi:hypothetical protein